MNWVPSSTRWMIRYRLRQLGAPGPKGRGFCCVSFCGRSGGAVPKIIRCESACAVRAAQELVQGAARGTGLRIYSPRKPLPCGGPVVCFGSALSSCIPPSSEPPPPSLFLQPLQPPLQPLHIHVHTHTTSSNRFTYTYTHTQPPPTASHTRTHTQPPPTASHTRTHTHNLLQPLHIHVHTHTTSSNRFTYTYTHTQPPPTASHTRTHTHNLLQPLHPSPTRPLHGGWGPPTGCINPEANGEGPGDLCKGDAGAGGIGGGSPHPPPPAPGTSGPEPSE